MRFAIITALLLVLAGTTPALAQSKIGYVNLQEALASIPDGKKVQAQLEGILKKKQTELATERDEIRAKGEALQKQKAMMSQEAFQKEAQTLQQRMAGLQEAVMISNQELAQKEKELAAPILQKMGQIIEDVAKERGFDIVLDRAAILYGQSDANLTDELVKRYNTTK
jgi:outer membrane protein